MVELVELHTDEDGLFESMTVMAPESFAAIDISYISGAEVIEQGIQFSDELESGCIEKSQLNLLREYDGRFDILHFEQTEEGEDDGELGGMLDPSALLTVLDILSELCGGVTVDPQTGSLI